MKDRLSLSSWLSLLGLSFATFIFNTSEFIPIGLLTDIRTDFGLTEASAGMLISVYAWAVMLLSLPLMLLVSRMELRRLMLWLVALFTIFQVGSFMAGSYAVLMASRIGVACTHAVFWSVISPIAVRIVPDKFRAVALSMVVTGSSVAMVLGMPLGRVIGLHLGWRMTFLSIGIFSALTFLYLAWRLPSLPSRGGFSVRQLPGLLRQKGITGLYIFTLLISTSFYVAYSYIEPFLKDVAHMPSPTITLTLILFGCAGFLGSVAFSKFYGRNRKRFVTVIVLATTLCLAILCPAANVPAAVIAVCAVWGMGSTAYNVSMQSNVILATSPESTSVAMSIFSGIFNLGIGSGAYIGGAICTHSSLAYVGYAGAAFGLIGLLYWAMRLGNRVCAD